jgi:hypothetical protein
VAFKNGRRRMLMAFVLAGTLVAAPCDDAVAS